MNKTDFIKVAPTDFIENKQWTARDLRQEDKDGGGNSIKNDD